MPIRVLTACILLCRLQRGRWRTRPHGRPTVHMLCAHKTTCCYGQSGAASPQGGYRPQKQRDPRFLQNRYDSQHVIFMPV